MTRLSVTIMGVALAAALSGCGRDDNQEKAGAASSAAPAAPAAGAGAGTPDATATTGAGGTGASGAAAASAGSGAGGGEPISSMTPPLQTGEADKGSTPLPDGSRTGARSTQNPK